jgi:hypothetical protein
MEEREKEIKKGRKVGGKKRLGGKQKHRMPI